MNYRKIAVVAASLVFAMTINTKQTFAQSTGNIVKYKNYDGFLIEDSKNIFTPLKKEYINLALDRKSPLCQINQNSILEDWINLFCRLIILVSFGSVGVMGSSVLTERYVKLIVKDILPVFLIIFISISLLGITSAIATFNFSSLTASTSFSVSSQNSCISK
ncbi:hypothetical protein Riv7116_4572 [Rivularia sp. PCC 7116]|uniref:hypothetical protein n=1 Tax=Rivularia sp. PCC 7116 TaxID=373994 RepID=UPI00029F24CC|nr:hypothetical protein [Rivularia sp. PCC 7116]AFY56991.1 hypothetical protein Riv7116_4572 [Rivularia sp. PCC 7116]